VPLLTWIVPAGSIAISPATGVPMGDQFPEIVHAEAVVAVHVNVVTAIIASPQPVAICGMLNHHGVETQQVERGMSPASKG
jgi:hypothetical protein